MPHPFTAFLLKGYSYAIVEHWGASHRINFVPESFDLPVGSMFASATTTRRAAAVPKTLSVRPTAPRRQSSCVARSCGEGRLVGLPAPEFEAEAVFDQEFINLKLSDYKYVIPVGACLVYFPLAASDHAESPSIARPTPVSPAIATEQRVKYVKRICASDPDCGLLAGAKQLCHCGTPSVP